MGRGYGSILIKKIRRGLNKTRLPRGVVILLGLIGNKIRGVISTNLLASFKTINRKMAIVRTDVIEGYYKLCVEKAVESGRIDFIVKGGLICEEVVEAIDINGNVQFRFIPPTVRISTEHWEFAGELHLYEKEADVARGALAWLEQVSDYLCLATAGAPIKMEPFREILTVVY
jgi:hypothetical protein